MLRYWSLLIHLERKIVHCSSSQFVDMWTCEIKTPINFFISCRFLCTLIQPNNSYKNADSKICRSRCLSVIKSPDNFLFNYLSTIKKIRPHGFIETRVEASRKISVVQNLFMKKQICSALNQYVNWKSLNRAVSALYSFETPFFQSKKKSALNSAVSELTFYVQRWSKLITLSPQISK